MDAHQRTVTTIKTLAMDAVQAANSGHPGMPMGAADMATVLWKHFLVHDPASPRWFDRDRFVLSAGHGSMLLYSLLHLAGYDLSIGDLKAFRQWGSRTPGHPEFGHTAGVETTTGPLGQGFATGVGMAIAERWFRETYGVEICDHYTYAIVSDGDLMEGISSEAGSLAGHLALGRMVYLYDDNQISIDGSTDLAFTEDVLARFAAFGWHVVRVDGHDAGAIAGAIEAARAETTRPSLVACRTVIGQGSDKEGTSGTHGAPLGAADVAATKRRLGVDPDATFVVDAEAVAWMRDHDGVARREAWEARLAAHPKADEIRALLAGDGAALVDRIAWPSFAAGSSTASRKASAACLKAIVAAQGGVVGGSADLAGSNGVEVGGKSFAPTDFAHAQTLHFGVREHAMAAAANGIALHGGLVPYVATFLMFHDYMRPSVRLSALMGQRVVYVYTHDSFYLGEDGPTHQPVETLLAMRSIPGLHVFRPADAAETAEGWKAALARHDGPTALVLTRQNLPELARTVAPVTEAARGAYVLAEPEGTTDVVLIATGSEVSLAMEAREVLAGRGVGARVVSAPCLERFAAQDAAYRASVLLTGVPRVSVEAGVTLGWDRWVGDGGASVGIDHFGASAPAEELARQFGFTADHVADVVSGVLGR